jgi:ferric-dicitrate binding protein FerR (iron transport regulator)
VRGEIAIEKQIGSNTSGNQILLKPNQSATFFKNTRKLALNKLIETRIEKADNSDELELIAGEKKSNLVVINKMNPETQVSWKDGRLTFKRETFENLTKIMERWFNKAIEIKASSLQKVRFSGTFDNETVEQALDALSLPVPFRYVVQKDSIFIYKK